MNTVIERIGEFNKKLCNDTLEGQRSNEIKLVTTYTSETWASTRMEGRIVKMQEQMERSMLGITHNDRWIERM